MPAAPAARPAPANSERRVRSLWVSRESTPLPVRRSRQNVESIGAVLPREPLHYAASSRERE